MKTAWNSAACLAMALALAGCSSAAGLLGKSAPDERQVTTGQSLAMPPDLNLPAPGDGDAGYQAPAGETNTAVLSNPDTPDVGANPDSPAPATAAGKQDVFTQYGIARTKPDGTKKTDEQMIEELRQARLAEKRRKNPGYGTFRNIGDLFKDG